MYISDIFQWLFIVLSLRQTLTRARPNNQRHHIAVVALMLIIGAPRQKFALKVLRASNDKAGSSCMTLQELSQAKDQDLINSVAAMNRAAALARQVAIQTDTAIIVYLDNKIVRLTAAELQQEMMALP